MGSGTLFCFSLVIAATASPGTLIHSAVESAAPNEWDEVWIRATNPTGSPVKLTIEWGGSTSSDQIEITVPAESGFTEVIPGHVLHNGAEVRAFAASADALVVHGVVNRFEIAKY